ncbi:ABC transporter ATP-binding protein [Tabrizicola sp. DMG-N-6]|uniref:ABC transporter ATP-binding protein n=2 Tax=Szabonella alba TaxID=2804194 RepID=A0A8K0VBG9_9RHOB|nr:ABC transporter ATP-binding protein [Szabonella alba]MBL4919134.1 ABC transporter ATP-binding protein [Szabonella alba]
MRAPAAHGQPAPPVLLTEGLTRRFGGFHAVRNVSFTLNEGEIHGLIGPNGAGKSTLFNLVTRMLPASSGRILYRGQDISRMPPARVARMGLVRSFQISALFGEMTSRQNLHVALMRGSGLGWRAWMPDRSLRRFDPAAQDIAARVGLTDVLDQPAAALSYGRKRALELGMALALDPGVLLLDEPLAGMGHEDIDTVCDLIRDAARGRTVLMVEHNLGVVERLCDRVTVLQRGEVIASGDYTDIAAHPQVRSAYLGAEDD